MSSSMSLSRCVINYLWWVLGLLLIVYLYRCIFIIYFVTCYWGWLWLHKCYALLDVVYLLDDILIFCREFGLWRFLIFLCW